MSNKKVIAVFVLFAPLFTLAFNFGVDDTRYSFIYEYNVPSQVTFDLRKSYSVSAGSVKLLNNTNKHKKFRYINNSPLGYFFNKKTKQIRYFPLVPHSTAPEKSDSVFWALLSSGTFHTPVEPKQSITLTLYLNINSDPKPQESMVYIIKNHKDLEYHIFNPINFPPKGVKNPKAPDAIIRSINVILP